MPHPELAFEPAPGRYAVLLNLPAASLLPPTAASADDGPAALLRSWLEEASLLWPFDEAATERLAGEARRHGNPPVQRCTLVPDSALPDPAGPLPGGGLYLGSFDPEAAPDSPDSWLVAEAGSVAVWVNTHYWDQGTFDHDYAELTVFATETPVEDALTSLAPNAGWLPAALAQAHEFGIRTVDCAFLLAEHSYMPPPSPVANRFGAWFLGSFSSEE